MPSFVCVLEDEYEEIQLFHGAIDRPCGLGRFVLAVTRGDVMVLKFKLGGEDGVALLKLCCLGVLVGV